MPPLAAASRWTGRARSPYALTMLRAMKITLRWVLSDSRSGPNPNAIPGEMEW
jgi:predicted mannosyl-3-phosphoglycerate phosphatase (HAD superfamily)